MGKKFQRKKMKNNGLIWICLTICFLNLGFFYLNENGYFNPKEDIVKTDTVITTKTDTLWKDTTITKTKLVPKYIYKTKVDTVYDANQNPIELVTENKVYNDTIVCEKDTAELQIFTSGIKSSVDSINLSLKKSEIIKTNTIEITKYVDKKKTFWNRFHIGVQGGYGYGFNYKGLEPYIGLGGSFDL